MLNGVDAFPLCWPLGWARCSNHKKSRYEVSFLHARSEVLDSLRMLHATDVVISSGIPTRHDGLPYATYNEPRDPGVAVYWEQDDKPQVMACDQWRTARENLRAIGLALEALRALQRSGASQVFERAFSGFAALPASTERPWREVLGFNGTIATRDAIEVAFRLAARDRHPDGGGSHEAMTELNRAREQALKELGA